jgi:hypothetical protein
MTLLCPLWRAVGGWGGFGNVPSARLLEFGYFSSLCQPRLYYKYEVCDGGDGWPEQGTFLCSQRGSKLAIQVHTAILRPVRHTQSQVIQFRCDHVTIGMVMILSLVFECYFKTTAGPISCRLYYLLFLAGAVGHQHHRDLCVLYGTVLYVHIRVVHWCTAAD